eukprot:366212-Chlamydomonas_euryale.AAC.2
MGRRRYWRTGRQSSIPGLLQSAIPALLQSSARERGRDMCNTSRIHGWRVHACEQHRGACSTAGPRCVGTVCKLWLNPVLRVALLCEAKGAGAALTGRRLWTMLYKPT